MSRPKRSGSMGPVFAKMLAAYEYCERKLVDMNPNATIEVDASTLGDALLGVIEEQERTEAGLTEKWMSSYISPLVHRWGSDARQIRSAFKFKTTMPVLRELADAFRGKSGEFPGDTIFKMPFPECVLVVEGIEKSDFKTTSNLFFTSACLFIEERIYTVDPESDPGPWYTENNINPGDKFICVTASFMINGETFTLLPIEFHATTDRPFDGPEAGAWCPALPMGTPPISADMLERMGIMCLVLVGSWIAALNHPARRIEDTLGLKPGVKHRAPKNKERRFYEHKMVTIDPLKAYAIGGATGYGSKHRLHPVRGFWRHIRKSGKRVWVRPHWRGDKDLGVITHDYEVKHGDMQDRELHEHSSLPLSSGLRSMLQRLGILARKITGAQETPPATDSSTGVPDGVHDR